MYKKIILSFLILSIISGCSASINNNDTDINKKYDAKQLVKSVWITYYELSDFVINKSQEEFEKDISAAFKELSKNGFTRVTLQVRPFADAFYYSKYFPSSSYCVGEQGKELEFDPLDIMCKAAKKNKLELEAWINPYRVSYNDNFDSLSDDNIALEWKDSENLIVTDKGIYFNPSSKKVIDLIINGVRELADNYDICSICFDDYFYPSTDEEIDDVQYEKYIEEGGDLSLNDWRRNNVNSLIKGCYSAVKDVNSEISFGVSPAANISNNYNNLYADVEFWSVSDGYIDYINPQIYFGFQNEKQPFMKTVKEWAKMAECDIYVSLPLYKSNLEDEFAGERGKNEFRENNNIIARQFTYLSKLDEIDGVYIFSYSFLGNNDETDNLYSAMQTSSR